jgi:hypothetical protein
MKGLTMRQLFFALCVCALSLCAEAFAQTPTAPDPASRVESARQRLERELERMQCGQRKRRMPLSDAGKSLALVIV